MIQQTMHKVSNMFRRPNLSKKRTNVHAVSSYCGFTGSCLENTIAHCILCMISTYNINHCMHRVGIKTGIKNCNTSQILTLGGLSQDERIFVYSSHHLGYSFHPSTIFKLGSFYLGMKVRLLHFFL